MATLVRQAIVSPPRPPLRLLFDFAQQNPLLNILFTPPGNPVFSSELSYLPRALRNSAQYFDPPNITLTLPVVVNITQPRAPCFQPRFTGPARNVSLYFDSPNVTISGQGALASSPVRPVDLTQRLFANRPLNIEYPPNLSLAILNSNPYVPADLSGRVPVPPRNASLYFEAPNLVLKPSTGLPPIFPPDWNRRAAVRQPITFDAPNLAVLLNTGAQPPPTPDLSLPVRPAPRCVTIYAVPSTLLPSLQFIPAVLPPAVYPDLSYRYVVRRNPSSVEWIEPQRALLASPVLISAVPNLSYLSSSGVQIYQAGLSFSGAVSFSIAPALDAGIVFNTITGAITTTTGTAALGAHGPYTITATNPNGSAVSNAFSITINAGDYQVDGPRVTQSTTSLGATYTVSGPFCTRDHPESEDLS